MSATEESQNVFEKFNETVNKFRALEHKLDKDYFAKIEGVVKNALKELTDTTGEYLHELGTKYYPSEDLLEEIIDIVP